MNTTDVPQQRDVPTIDGADNQRKFDALCRLIQRGQGRFAFVLVEFDLPRQRDAVLGKLREAFPDLNVVTVVLTPLPPDISRAFNVLDQLNDLVKTASPHQTPDVLIITGYETLFPDAIEVVSGRPAEQLARAIQPLNLGRNILAEAFPCPILLCLPTQAMAVFLRSAPDLSSWRSGFYQFQSDIEHIHTELTEAAQEDADWRTSWWAGLKWYLRTLEERRAEAQKLAVLIADAEALCAEKKVIAWLYERLGWASVKLGNRTQARWAFDQMMQLAREANDDRLVRHAEEGQKAAQRITPRVQISPQQTAATQQVFRGAAALTETDELYGREEELHRLLGQIVSVGTRFLTIWGERGCGKTSLLLAGLVPELKRREDFLPVVVSRWDTPEGNVRHALEHASALSLEPFGTLHDCLQHVAWQTEKTVVVVCDQFEQFFILSPERRNREPFLRAVGACYSDFRIPCKFVFAVHEDLLGRMAEFEEDVPEPLEQRKRFYLPLFSATDAVRVLRHMAEKAALGWSEGFIYTVVADLTKDGRVRPFDLQFVGVALAMLGINNELDYAHAGRAPGLLEDYFGLVLDSLTSDRGRQGQMRKILRVLVTDSHRRLTLSAEEIASYTKLKSESVIPILDHLIEAHLVHRVDIPLHTDRTPDQVPRLASPTSSRYELIHDALVDFLLE